MRLGIDLGGTKTEAAVINDDGVVVWRHRITTERQTYQTIIQSLADLTQYAHQETGYDGAIGIAIPGRYDPSQQVIKGASLRLLNNKTFVADVSAATNRPVRVANDANCFALSEALEPLVKSSSTSLWSWPIKAASCATSSSTNQPV